MNVLYISTFLNDETLAKFNSKVINNFSFSANKYSELIRKGLEANEKIHCEYIFSPAIGDYSVTKIAYYVPRKTRISPKGIYLSCINITFLKQISICLKVFFYSLVWFCTNINKKNKLIMLSSIQLSFLLGVLPLKLLRIKIVLFVPDLPIFQYNYTTLKGKVKQLILPIYIKLCSILYNIISYYVFITMYMKSKFPQRPYTVMEGLVEPTSPLISVNKYNVFTVLYAGSLHESMGIRQLLDAIDLIPNDNIQFLFLGKGDLVNLIVNKANKDPRIIYKGVVANNEIIQLEAQVHLLINPRPTSIEYTKYSFPSKLMEYMLSGTPVLTTLLSGITPDYYDKMYYIEDETPFGIKESILNCMNKSQDELDKMGLYAQKYVQEEKNCVTQIEKILNNLNVVFFNK